MTTELLKRLDVVAQALVPGLTVATTWLLARHNKWGCVVGLAAQPLWATTYIVHGQRGPLGTYESFFGRRERDRCRVCCGELREVPATDPAELHEQEDQS